ncbi:LysR family transcriptional regulator [Rhodobacteraceae bacterium]|nr:LysR family transcriptional regulator [Paracoccaceae bacterium]
MEDLDRRFTSLKPFLMFESAARKGSFSAVAQAFNISQPSVSRNIAQLEREIGVTLFERRVSGVRLTPEGHDLFHAVTQGFGRILETVDDLQRRAGRRENVVSVSVSGSFVAHWMAPRLADFTNAFPNVDLQFQLISGLMPEFDPQIDLSIRTMDHDMSGPKSVAFCPEMVLPVCNHAYLNRPSDMTRPTFLHFAGHDRKIWRDMTPYPMAHQQPDGHLHEFDDYSITLQAALNGTGIALGWVSVVARLLIEGRLVAASPHLHKTGRHHQILISPRTERPVTCEIANWLAARMSEDIRQLDL